MNRLRTLIPYLLACSVLLFTSIVVAEPNSNSLCADQNCLPRLTIAIETKDFVRLSKEREGWAKDGMRPAEREQVMATISDGAHSYPATVRLKGTQADHADPKRPSLHVEIKDGRSILGLTKLSLQAPERRGNQLENLFHQELKRNGLHTIRYEFLKLTVNENDWGTVALEEVMAPEFLRRNDIQDGLAFRFDKDLRQEIKRNNPELNYMTQDWQATPLDFLTCNSENCQALENVVTGLMLALAQGHIKPSQVFESEKVGKFLATVEFFDARHCLSLGDMRMLFNAKTNRVEFVAYDGDPQRHEASELLQDMEKPFLQLLLQDPIIYRSFRQSLATLISKDGVHEFLRWLLPQQENLIKQLSYASPSEARFYDLHRFNDRLKLIRESSDKLPNGQLIRSRSSEKILDLEKQGDLPLVASAFLRCSSNSDSYSLQLFNNIPVPIVVHSVNAFQDDKRSVIMENAILTARTFPNYQSGLNTEFKGPCPESVTLNLSLQGGARGYEIVAEKNIPMFKMGLEGYLKLPSEESFEAALVHEISKK